MIELDHRLMHDEAGLATLSAADQFTVTAMTQLRAQHLRDRVSQSFKQKRKVVLMNTTKNEISYILEWIAYHRVLGVDGFVLLDNNSGGLQPEMLHKLHEAGIVCAVTWPTIHPFERQQISAFASTVQALQAQDASEWVGFLDLDEFYVSRRYDTMDEILANLPQADAYHLTWLFYGSGGATKREDGLVIERFQKRGAFDHPKNWQGKPLAKLQQIAGHYHHPHNLKMRPGAVGKLPDGTVFDGTLPDRREKPQAVAVIKEAKTRSAEILAVHHYAVRSREEFDKKAKAGRVNYIVGEARREFANLETYFKSHDLNGVADAYVAGFAGRVKDEIDMIIDLAGIRHLL